MKNNTDPAAPPLLVDIVVQYDSLLQRYARRIVKDEEAAGLLAATAFQKYYTAAQQAHVADLRNTLKQYTLQLCRNWLRYRQLCSSRLN